MIIDYCDEGSLVDLDTDICIVGSGPAGISIALSFLATSVNVCIIEGGGICGESSSQQLYQGISRGSPPLDLFNSRLRAFGGSSQVWGGGCLPLSSMDLARRDWVPGSGWPLSYQQIEPYYVQARRLCGIESRDFVDGSFVDPPMRAPLEFDGGTLANKLFISNAVDFGRKWGPEIGTAPNITVLLHANLRELEASTCGASVRQASIGTLGGKRGVIRAKRFVLACGGIENARLLLLSDGVLPQGLGNQHDLVGRYFMDHPSGRLGTLHTHAPDALTEPYDHNREAGALPSLPEICLSDAVVQEQKLLAARVRPVAVEGPVPKGIAALRDLRARWRASEPDRLRPLDGLMSVAGVIDGQGEAARSKSSAGTALGVLRVAAGAGDIAKAVVRKVARRTTVRTGHIDLVGYFEQAPNPASRVTLADERDALGLRKVCLDWQLTPLDWHTYRTAARLFGAELARSCGGRFQLDHWLEGDDAAAPPLRGTAHHMGTTRMAEAPREGVVDRDCKVHGVDNLYVIGSSVFPTGGWAFPTFTIVALSLRLAEHLRPALEMTGL